MLKVFPILSVIFGFLFFEAERPRFVQDSEGKTVLVESLGSQDEGSQTPGMSKRQAY